MLAIRTGYVIYEKPLKEPKGIRKIEKSEKKQKTKDHKQKGWYA